MIKNLKLKLLLFTFLCNSPLYSMEPEELPSPIVPKKKLSNEIDKDCQKHTKIEQLIKFQLKSKHIGIKNMIEAEDLEQAFLNFKKSLFDQHIFLVPVNTAILDSEAGKASHLVGIQISKNANNQEKCTIDYLDPTGEPISKELSFLFKRIFNKDEINELPISNNKTQFLKNNNDEQAIFLTYLFMHQKKIKFLKEKKTLPAIENLSEFNKCLRNIFDLEIQIPDLAHEAEPEAAKNLAKIFGKLGKLYIELGDTTKDVSYYNEAALFYNYRISMIENNEYLKILKKPYDQLNFIQRKLVNCIGGNGEKIEEFEPGKFVPYDLLFKLREEIKEKIKEIDKSKENYIEDSKNLFHNITGRMGNFLANLYEKAEEIVGEAPCDYTIIGLGSLALKQMTPYSDLEFAILISDQKDEDSSQKVKNYFKNLTQLVHFWVINLNETIIPPDKYNCNTRHLVRKAVNFDLGGKTPLGLEDKPYELICTVDNMLRYMRNEGEKSEHIDATLPYILQKVSYVHGKKDLFNKYNEQTKEFLKVHGEPRAIKILWEGCYQIDYANYSRKEHKMEGNIKQFSFNPGESSGRKFNVKQEIYRLPDRFIYNFGLIYGIDAEDNWETITQLAYQEKYINETAEINIKKALTFAALLRLKVYSYYNQHNDEIDWDEGYNDLDQKLREKLIKHDMPQMYTLSHEFLQERGALYEYYYVARPLTIKLVEFCSLRKNLPPNAQKNLPFEKISFFHEESFYDDSVDAKVAINVRLKRIVPALGYRELKFNKLIDQFGQDSPQVNYYYRPLGVAYAESGDYKKAIEYLEKARVTENSVDKLCSIYNCLGQCWLRESDYQKSEHFFLESLKLQKQNRSFAENRPTALLIDTYIGLGDNLADQHKFVEAIEYIKKSLTMSETKLGKYDSLTAYCYNSYGTVSRKIGQKKEALDYLNESLKIHKKIFSKNHPSIVKNYQNLAEAYGSDNPTKAVENYQEVLGRCKQNLDKNYGPASSAYIGIAVVYKDRKEYQKAQNYCEKGLKILEKKLDLAPTDTASSYGIMADILNEMKQYAKALTYCQRALNIFEKNLNKDGHHIANIYHIMTEVFMKLGYKAKGNILCKASKKIKKNEHHFYLRKWGKINDKTANIMVAIASQLDGISQDVLKSSYSQIKKKITQLCQKYKDKNDQEIAKMLCFEGICLSVAVREPDNKDPLLCLNQFCKENPNLVIEISKFHPEYFCEEEIVRKCIEYFPNDLKILEDLLQEQ